ncbi:hypothetical protein CQ062_18695, partial [Ochrobactrum sp. MYb68]
RQAHNLKAAGSNPAPATKFKNARGQNHGRFDVYGTDRLYSPTTDTRRPNAHNLKGEEKKQSSSIKSPTNRTKPHTKTKKAKNSIKAAAFRSLNGII